MKNILIVCTGNSFRSQIAHGYMASLVDPLNVSVYSAGIETHGLNPKAVQLMKDDGIDISKNTSNNIIEYKDINFDFVITVCDNAKENCPIFPTQVKIIHQNFKDPSKVIGTDIEIKQVGIEVRNAIKVFCQHFVKEMDLEIKN